MSAIIPRAVGQCLVNVSVASKVNSRRASVPKREPINSKSAANSKLERLVVPSASICDVKLASPGRPRGSAVAPASSIRPKATRGRPGCSTTAISNPLFNRCRRGIGGVKDGSVAGSGIRLRSKATVVDCCKLCSGSTLRRTCRWSSTDSLTRKISSRCTAMYRSRLVLIKPGSLANTLK